MKIAAILGVAVALFVGGALAEPPDRTAERATDHQWLKQLVGEWDIRFKIHMQPDEPPVEAEGTDSVRALGDHWVIAETRTTMMGAPYSGILSLGYNAQEARFNGTWIDSMGGRLWVYQGALNDAGDALTLETEGPSLETPGKTARYREVIRITGEDSRSFTSSYESEEGEWVRIVTIEYRRKK